MRVRTETPDSRPPSLPRGRSSVVGVVTVVGVIPVVVPLVVAVAVVVPVVVPVVVVADRCGGDDPSLAAAQRGLGLALVRTGRLAEGQAALRRYLALDPAAGDAGMIAALIARPEDR